jgi:threonine dehydrogenase-like Zn-dependent dehydrogenase
VEGRIIIGSWYGTKAVCLNLGGRFHHRRIRLIGSQVSTLAAGLTGRWSKQRRFGVVWEQIRYVQPRSWITQRFSIEDAPSAYALLSEAPEQAIQVILEH